MASDGDRGPAKFLFGDGFEVDLRSYQLRRNGELLKLERIPMELLRLLIENRGELVSRESIAEKIWGKGVYLDTDASINAAVRKVRFVLRDDPEQPHFIQTVTGRGYRFIAEVTEVPVPAPQAVHLEPERPALPVPPPQGSSAKSTIPAIRRWTAVSAVALLLIVAGLIFFGDRARVFSRATSGRTIKARRSVAVLGFRNLSQNPDQAWISTALTEMLNTELAAGRHVRVIPSETVTHMKSELSLLSTESYGPATLQKVRNYLGVDVIVVGSYLAIPANPSSKVRVDVQMQDTSSGDIIAAVSRTGSEGELADVASGGGATLRTALGITDLKGSLDQYVRSTVPSGSVSGRLYAEGLAKQQAFDADGARTLLQSAVEADPGNALIHSALAESLSTLGYDKQAEAEAKKAFDLSGGLAKEDRLLIEGRYRDLIHDRPGTIEVYSTLHKLLPDDVDVGLKLATSQTRGGKGRDALETVKELRQISGVGERDPRIDLAEASALQSQGSFNESLAFTDSGFNHAQAQGNRLLMADALRLRSWALHRLSRFEDSIEASRKAQELSVASGNTRLSASLLHGIAITLRDQGKYEEARGAYLEALKQFRQLGAMWDVASCSHNLGVLYYDEGRIPDARKHLEEALRIQREISDDRGVAADLDDLSNVVASEGDLPRALKMKQEALEIFRRIGDRKGEAIALSQTGYTQWLSGDLSGAKDSFDRSLAIKTEIGDRSGQGFAWFGMSMVQLDQGYLDEAKKSADQAMTIRQDLHDESRGAESKIQLAEIAIERNDAPQAERLAREAAAVLDREPISSVTSECYGVLARALAAQGKVEEARAASQKALTAAKKTGDVPSRMSAEVSSAAALERRLPNTESTLKKVSAQAKHGGFIGIDLETRFQIARFSTPAAARSNQMRALREEAKQRGYLLLARKADQSLGLQGGDVSQLARK